MPSRGSSRARAAGAPDIALTFMWDHLGMALPVFLGDWSARYWVAVPGVGSAAPERTGGRVASPPKSISVTARPLDRCHPVPVAESPRSRKYIAPLVRARGLRAFRALASPNNTRASREMERCESQSVIGASEMFAASFETRVA